MNKIIVIALLTTVVAVSGCASNKAYRTNLVDSCVLSDSTCAASLEISGANQTESRVALAYVEINDQGLLRDRGQLIRADQVIRLRGQKQPQVVLAFVHGWHHNADADNGNVKRFRRILNRYATQHPDVAVTGIYVGWRGTTWRFSNPLTFWTRKAVSIEVGQGALVDVLATVERAAQQSDSMLISIGHSFGGSALFNATKAILLSRLDHASAFDRTVPFPMHASLGDLVLILNPAFEAMQYWPLHSAVAHRLGERAPIKDAGPRLMIYQSQADWATRYAFPIARAYTPILEFFEHAGDSDSTDQPPYLKEWRLDLFGIGHFHELNTHDVTGPKTPVNPNWSSCGHNIDPYSFADGQWESPNAQIKLQTRELYKPGNPFWVVYDTVLGIGHSDLEDDRMNCMMADLLSTYGRRYEIRKFGK